MSGDKELIALIDLIYQAALDNDLWPGLLIKLADAMGASQVSMTSRDQRADIFTTLSPRTDRISLLRTGNTGGSKIRFGSEPHPGESVKFTCWTISCREGITRPLPYLTNGGSHPGAALRGRRQFAG